MFSPSYAAYAATLVLTGFSVVTTLTTANGYVQTTTDPALRGRVLALYMAILLGGTPVGAPIVGAVAAQFGPRVAIALAAVVALIACGIGIAWTLASGRVHRHETKRFRLTVDETRPILTVAPEPEDFSDEIAGTTPSPATRRACPAAHAAPAARGLTRPAFARAVPASRSRRSPGDAGDRPAPVSRADRRASRGTRPHTAGDGGGEQSTPRDDDIAR